MKRMFLGLLCVMVIFSLGCGAGGLTPNGLNVKAGGEVFEFGASFEAIVPDEVINAERGVIEKNGVRIFKHVMRDEISRIEIQVEEASLGCSVRVGDQAGEAVKALGKNVGYDERPDHHSIGYLYYAKNGKLYNVTEFLSLFRLYSGPLNKEEEEYYETIEDDLDYYDDYSVSLMVRDGIIEGIAIDYINKSVFRDE